MDEVHGIIVHQSSGPTAESAFNSYRAGQAGAHFLIAKDGTIYQTASIKKQTWHVGKLRSRCLAELRCSAEEMKLAQKYDPSGTNRREMGKLVPDRYPANRDSIGIEIVGQALPLTEPDGDKRTYETVNETQNISLKWLISELRATLSIPMSEIFRHPVVSRKNKTEAATASW